MKNSIETIEARIRQADLATATQLCARVAPTAFEPLRRRGQGAADILPPVLLPDLTAGRRPAALWRQWGGIKFLAAMACARKRSVLAIVFASTLTGVLCGGSVDRIPGRLLVKPHSGVKEVGLQRLFAAYGARQQTAIHPINVRILQVPEERLATVLEALRHNPNIEFAEMDAIVAPVLIPNDTDYADEWHLERIQAPGAWDMTTGSSSVTIAILDTGVDGTHPDLAPNLVPGWNFYDNNSDTSDVYGHGTTVAGVAAAAGNNSTGVASVAFDCRFMPIRVSGPDGYGSYSAIASGLIYAADHGARVANISYQVTESATVTSAAQYFQSKHGVTTVAAGNDATFYTAADNPYVLTVSATDANDLLESWSNMGSNIDLAAPGSGIRSTALGGSYGTADGSSLAAPIVAGVAALAISVNPNLTGAQVQDILKETADQSGAPGWNPRLGWGRVNARNAVLAAQAVAGAINDLPPAPPARPMSPLRWRRWFPGSIYIPANDRDSEQQNESARPGQRQRPQRINVEPAVTLEGFVEPLFSE